MLDRNKTQIEAGASIKFDVNGHYYLGVVAGFEQVGTPHENVLVDNSTIGYEVDGSRRANVWPRNITVMPKTREQIIESACTGFFSATRVSQEFCSHDGCVRDAVVQQPDPEETWYQCYYHLTTMEMLCDTCGTVQVVTDYKSGRSMGGCGTIEVWDLACGHSGGYEDDDISYYV